MRDFFSEFFERYPKLNICKNDILSTCDILESVFKNNNKLLLCGNGGSASDCGHIAGELLKSFQKRPPLAEEFRKLVGDDIANNLQMALPAISLPDMVGINTAYANDCNAQYTFAQLVYGLGRKGDALLAISTSGNAKNVNLAAIVAKAKGMTIIGLTGGTGGSLKNKCDICIQAPEQETFKIQELHLPIYHTICLILEQRIFRENC